ncbi:unnamed protein product [Heterobilharzia americana]|nr:unnamed protein product [Heterobilharzia americana]
MIQLRTSLLIIGVLAYSPVWTLEIAVNKTKVFDNTTETHYNVTQPKTHSYLLKARYMELNCFRLYSERSQQGYWSDMCDSNEALSPYQVWTTKSVCAPGVIKFTILNYWLIYERPNFYGQYIFLGPGQCIFNIHQYGMQSVGSLLKCKKSPYYSTLHCNYPMQPWRQYHGLSENEAYKMSIKELLTNRSTSMSQSLQQQPLMGNVKLSDLTQGSVNGMSTSA